MKYTIITVNSEGYYSTQTIDATTIVRTPDFITFKKGKSMHMLASDTVISINTEGYDLEDKPKQTLTTKKTNDNAKVIQLFKGQK